MARNAVISTGTGYSPKNLLTLFCEAEQATTPHTGGRVMARTVAGVVVAVRCRRCGLVQEHTLSRLPDGLLVYRVRITGEDGPHLPDSMRPLPFLEESFEVVAASLQDAHERAEFACSLRFAGHLVCYYINGEEHLNERF
ncbi:hypothetical protein [Hymenobacter wooponensis]|uniref:Uncharacterized protein n=1 Tax=Hymenobacter wooponensis TaxID=1525360 RepID=A0A4Z0MQN3_9BACT|nr:hypothetical protein [Hymenobacter wooponensis]TGD81720.1 hypothetical protein EU557_09290 [Hymenobacter wooponensis]